MGFCPHLLSITFSKVLVCDQFSQQVFLSSFYPQAPANLLHPYPPIQHEDGLETAIEGLEFRVTEATFRQQPGPLSLTLKCVSSISTTDDKSRFTETHHRKESLHYSLGSLFNSGDY